VNVVLKKFLATILGALTLGLMLGMEPCKALEELKVYRGVLVFEGKIVAGDYNKLRTFLGTKSNFDKISGGVFLASPGGSVIEALKIGHLIRALDLSTDAPSGTPPGRTKFGESVIRPNNLVDPRTNYLCASACFFVYVAGIYRNLDSVGRLGVHRPVQSESNAKKFSDEQVFELTWRVRDTIKNYLKEMNVPVKYVDLAYSVPPNELRWITQEEFDTDLRGFIPELKDQISAKCDQPKIKKTITPPENTASDKKKIVSVPAEQSIETARCWMQARTELPTEAWHKVFLGK
jgi:hypothetical protein